MSSPISLQSDHTPQQRDFFAEFVWSQEEPRNAGAWSFVAPRFENALGVRVSWYLIGGKGMKRKGEDLEGKMMKNGADIEKK